MKKLCGAAFLSMVAALVVVPTASAHAQATSVEATNPKIDSAVFAAKPLMENPLLSPNGNLVAFRSTLKGKSAIAYVSLDGSRKAAFSIPAKMDLEWFRWIGNSKLLLSISRTINFEGEEFSQTSLISLDIDTSVLKFIGKRGQGFDGDNLIYADPSGSYGLLSVQESIYDYPSVHRVDFTTGAMTRVVGQKDTIWDWFADSSGVVRGGVGYSAGKAIYYYRSKDGQAFKSILKSKFDVEGDTDFIFSSELGAGTDDGYVLSDAKTGRNALYRFNFAERKLGEELFASDQYDVDTFVMKEDGSGPFAAYYMADYTKVKWFDPIFEKAQQDIDKALGARQGYIVSTSRDNKTMLIAVSASNNPGGYYVYNVDEGVMRKIAAVNDKLKPANLVPVQSVRYKARDGVEIPAYLTVPAGKKTGLPLIIMPHGGPYGIRDDMEYDPEVQFLANRGYAVLQPNYRGSGGYGRAFEKAGEGEYGRKMQDDLDDGMDWLVKQGTVDPKRVCVVGSSYGGYAAMWAVTRNPERYRCAASFAGISDLKRHIRYNKSFMYGKNKARWQERVAGDDKFDLDKVSALPNVAKMARPILIAHGDDDTRVLPVQSKSYAAALAKAGKEHEYYTYKDEGHGFSNATNLQHWFDKLEAFLAKHNPA